MPRGNRHEHPPSLIFRIFLENGGLWRSHSESQATPMAAQRSFTLNDSSTITPANLYTIPQLHGATRVSALASLCAWDFCHETTTVILPGFLISEDVWAD